MSMDLITVSDLQDLDVSVLSDTVGICESIGSNPIAVLMPYAQFERFQEIHQAMMEAIMNSPLSKELMKATWRSLFDNAASVEESAPDVPQKPGEAKP